MEKNKTGIKSFTKNFWTVIFMEFTERGSYYGVMSILAIYLTLSHADGGLALSKVQAGNILGIITPMVYLVPIIAGVFADRYGYKLCLTLAFAIMSTGYALSGMANTYTLMFGSMAVVALGAGMFKPVVSGTIATETNENNSSLGFGIFYWSINLGSFLFPLVLVPYLKAMSYSYVFILAAVCTGMLILVSLFVLKEPVRPKSNKTVKQVFLNIFDVLKDYKFVLLIVCYSGFWIMYFQMYGSVLWFLNDHIDKTELNNFVNGVLSTFVENPNWTFDVEHVTVMNSLTIISLQLLISSLVRNFKALPTMLVGIALGSLGLALLAFASNIWVFLVSITIFSVGEMTAHPKFISYVGQIAPADKKAQYMGYSFLYGVIGSGVGFLVGPKLYVKFIDELNQPTTLWLIFASMGVVTIISLYLLNKFVLAKKK